MVLNFSMDFECAWGDLERVTSDETFHRRVVEGLALTPEVIATLDRHGIPSTWGVVGGCCLNSIDELRERAPAAFGAIAPRLRALVERYPRFEEILFCPEVVHSIAAAPAIELGSHGFLHLTPGALPSSTLREDVTASTQVLRGFGRAVIESFIPPQNYVWPDEAFEGSGIKYVRHTPRIFGYSYSNPAVPAKFSRLWNDLVFPVDHNEPAEAGGAKLLFLRLDRGSRIWNAQLRLIRRLLASGSSSLYLFSHPHNIDTPLILGRFAELCGIIGEARDRGRVAFGRFVRDLSPANAKA